MCTGWPAGAVTAPFNRFPTLGNRDGRLALQSGLTLSDAGAHASQLCDACYSTYLLGHWVRDRKRRWWMPLPYEHEYFTDSILMAEDGFHPGPAGYALWRLTQHKYDESLQEYYEKKKILVGQQLLE